MEIFSILDSISKAVDASGQAMSLSLVDDNFSTRVLAICTGLELAWLLGMSMLDAGGLGEMMALAIRALALAMLGWVLILNWPTVTDDLTKTSAAVVSKIGKGQELGNIVSSTLSKALQNTKVDALYSTSDPQSDGGGWSGWLSKFSDLTFGALIDKILAAGLGLVNGGVVGIVAAIAIFIILLGKIVLWLGVAFGPLCISFMPWKPARRITESWASFTFAAMMFPAVAAAVLILSGGIFDALANMAAAAGAQTLPSTVYSIASLAIAIVAGLVMLQVPKITQAIFGNALGMDAPQLPKPEPKPASKNTK